jgi:hypothetical protein
MTKIPPRRESVGRPPGNPRNSTANSTLGQSNSGHRKKAATVATATGQQPSPQQQQQQQRQQQQQQQHRSSQCCECLHDGGDDCFECGLCAGWIHTSCAGIDEALIPRLSSDFIVVLCTKCQGVAASKRAAALSGAAAAPDAAERFDALERQLASVVTAVSALVPALSTGGAAADDSAAAVHGGSSSALYSAVAARNAPGNAVVVTRSAEDDEEAKHRHCLVFAGVPEEGNDYAVVSEICKKLDRSAEVECVFRMGTLELPKRGNTPQPAPEPEPRGPRLLKVRFRASTVARTILQQAPRLKDMSEYKGIYIRRSMSLADRKKLSALRKKSHELNKALEGRLENTDHYVVVNESLVVFRGCTRQDDGKLTGGRRYNVDYEFVENDGHVSVQVN